MERRLPLDGGEPRTLPPRTRRSAAAVDLSEKAEVTVVVRSRGSDEEWRKLVAELTGAVPGERRYLSHAEFARQWSASPRDLEAVRKFAKSQRLKVVSSDAFRRCVVVSGTLRQLGRAFGVEFQSVVHRLGTFRTPRAAPQLPPAIHPLVECILGLDTVPIARPHAAAAAPAKNGMNRQALLDAYAIPPHLHGKGQCVAVIELGGGFHKRDVQAYFKQLGLAPPRVRVRGIGGVKNDPAAPEIIREIYGSDGKPAAGVSPQMMTQAEWTVETTTDLDMIGTIAPEASIVLVQTSGDDQGQYHALTFVLADRKNAPSVLSCSWGGAESGQSPALMRAMERWFQAAAVLGITVCCSSGDEGDGTLNAPGSPKVLTVQFPASSPHVLACGGTTLHPKARTEVAWYQVKSGHEMASGGGFSEFFPLPPWQHHAGIDPGQWIPRGFQSGKGRAIPDVAAKANLDPAYSVIVGGIEIPAGGTSAAAPLWGALCAIFNEGLSTRVGSLLSPLYGGALRRGLRDIVSGNTGTFHACKGWDACTGWGSPRGEALLALLSGPAAARARARRPRGSRR